MAAARLTVVGHLHLVGVPGDAVDLAGSLDVAGVGVDVEVSGDAGAVDLHRRGAPMVVVLEMTPEGAVLDSARHAEVRVGAVVYVVPAAGDEIARDLVRGPRSCRSGDEHENCRDHEGQMCAHESPL